MHSPASGLGLLLEATDEIQDLPIVGPAVDQVAAQHRVILLTRSTEQIIGQTRRLEDRRQLVLTAMDVADGDDAPDSVPLPLRGGPKCATPAFDRRAQAVRA